MRGRSCIGLRGTSAVSVIYAFRKIYTFTQLIYASAIPQSILRITQFRKYTLQEVVCIVVIRTDAKVNLYCDSIDRLTRSLTSMH